MRASDERQVAEFYMLIDELKCLLGHDIPYMVPDKP